MRKRHTADFKAESVLEVLKEIKTVPQIASERGVHPNQLSTWKALVLQGLPSLFRPDQQALRAAQEAHERKLQELYAEIGRLTTQVNWLKKNLASTLPRHERLALVERDPASPPPKTQPGFVRRG